jgi:hypothetical protein
MMVFLIEGRVGEGLLCRKKEILAAQRPISRYANNVVVWVGKTA